MPAQMELRHEQFTEADVCLLDHETRTLDLAVVLPTFNETANIAPMIARLETALRGIGWEAIFVDDDSGDGTADAVRNIAISNPRIRIIQRIGRRGLASAAIEGMCATAAPYVAVMDADHQHDPALLPLMLDHVRSRHSDIAIGSRFIDGGSASGLSNRAREQGSHIANAIARKMTGLPLTDPMSGFFLLRSDMVRQNVKQFSGIGFKILLDILVSAKAGVTIKEFPIQFAPRRAGESKLDQAIAFDFLVSLYEHYLSRFVPTRFALFATVGALGVGIHMAVLWALLSVAGTGFTAGQALATLTAMTFNFWLNNFLTYRDKKLAGMRNLLLGWASFCAACLIGAFANIASAVYLRELGVTWVLAALAGVALGSVWNYVLSSRFVWSRFK